jgi:hypothetical protein
MITVKDTVNVSIIRSECLLENILYQMILKNQDGDIEETERIYAANINDVNTRLDSRLLTAQNLAKKSIDENQL